MMFWNIQQVDNAKARSQFFLYFAPPFRWNDCAHRKNPGFSSFLWRLKMDAKIDHARL